MDKKNEEKLGKRNLNEEMLNQLKKIEREIKFNRVIYIAIIIVGSILLSFIAFHKAEMHPYLPDRDFMQNERSIGDSYRDFLDSGREFINPNDDIYKNDPYNSENNDLGLKNPNDEGIYKYFDNNDTGINVPFNFSEENCVKIKFHNAYICEA